MSAVVTERGDRFGVTCKPCGWVSSITFEERGLAEQMASNHNYLAHPLSLWRRLLARVKPTENGPSVQSDSHAQP